MITKEYNILRAFGENNLAEIVQSQMDEGFLPDTFMFTGMATPTKIPGIIDIATPICTYTIITVRTTQSVDKPIKA